MSSPYCRVDGAAPTIAITSAVEGDALVTAATLFRAYADWLGIDLCFQDFEAELAGLPGAYAPPSGGIWLAWRGADPIGCIAVRPLDDDACEMKRLFVRPTARGGGTGRRLAEHAIAFARGAGYRVLRLDTIHSHMAAAVALYQALGFVETPPYCHNPVPTAAFYALTLRA